MNQPITVTSATINQALQPMTAWNLEPTTLDSQGTISLDLITTAARVVDTSGVIEILESWDKVDNPNRYRGGRPAQVSVRSALILLIVAGLDDKPLNITEAVEILRYRLDGKAWAAAGLDLRLFADRRNPQWYSRIYRTIRNRVRALIDPYPETKKGRRYDKDVFAALKATRSPALIEQRKKRIAIFDSALALGSARLAGDDVFKRHIGDYAVDATMYATSTTMPRSGSKLTSSEPDAGSYVREGNHHPGANKGAIKVKHGFDPTLAVAVGGAFGESVPNLIVGVSVDKPGHRPGQNVLQAVAMLERTGFPRRYMIGDMAYSPGSKPENYQAPMRKNGWKIVGDIPNKEEARGIAATYEGMVLSDGKMHCPALLALQQAHDPVADYRQGKIDEAEFRRLMALRERLEMRVHSVEEDGSVRVACPALDGRVSCPLLRSDLKAKKAGMKKVRGGKAPLPLSPKQTPKKVDAGRCCTQQTVTIPLDTEDKNLGRVNKYLQQGPTPYTPQWYDIYKAGRANNEGRNASLKYDAPLGDGDRSKKGMRGICGFAVKLAVQVVVSNAKRIRGYLRRQREEELNPTPPRGGRPRKKRQLDIFEIAWSNAPPEDTQAA